MKIIFTMAGLSSRFTKAGYTEVKYKLKLHGQSVFYYAVLGFKKYFKDTEFIFIYRDIQDTSEFLSQECKKLGIKHYNFIKLPHETLGQAHTAYLGLEKLNLNNNENILIFNIDTFHPNFSLPNLDLTKIDGYLEVFKAGGENWSFILPQANSDKVLKTTEKERISEFCSSGLYYFKSVKDYKTAFESLKKQNLTSKNEYYIAPMYNELIKANKDIRYVEIAFEELLFCGIPQEYETLLKNPSFIEKFATKK